MKTLIKQSYEMGRQSFGKLDCAPYLNNEFIKTLPNCEFGDDEGCKLRVKMMKAYIKGWTLEYLNKINEVCNE